MLTSDDNLQIFFFRFPAWFLNLQTTPSYNKKNCKKRLPLQILECSPNNKENTYRHLKLMLRANYIKAKLGFTLKIGKCGRNFFQFSKAWGLFGLIWVTQGEKSMEGLNVALQGTPICPKSWFFDKLEKSWWK